MKTKERNVAVGSRGERERTMKIKHGMEKEAEERGGGGRRRKAGQSTLLPLILPLDSTHVFTLTRELQPREKEREREMQQKQRAT